MSIEERLDRIEAHLAIQQLAVRYALAVDSRDLDLMVRQWVPDVWMGKAHGQGHDAVRRFFEPILSTFYRSIHMIVGHHIDVIDSDNASGVVYCRAEHEDGEHWVVQAIIYEDTYRRVEGTWGFVKRVHRHWYSSPVQLAPSGPTFENWPGRGGPPPDLPQAWRSWHDFWSAVDPEIISRHTAHPAVREQ